MEKRVADERRGGLESMIRRRFGNEIESGMAYHE
jgi:hypothetical protein